MAINFSAQFIVNEKTSTRVLRLTDTSTGFTLSKGNFLITFPNGTKVSNTDFISPQISAPGGSVNISLITDIDNTVLTGSYVISYVALDVSLNEYNKTESFDFNWEKPAKAIINDSDVVLPEVQFKDLTAYETSGSFTGTLTRNFFTLTPSTSEVGAITKTSVGDILMPSHNSKYYEGIYVVKSDISVAYTHSSKSWLTVAYTDLLEETFDVREAPTQDELVVLMNTYKDQIEAYKSTNPSQYEIMNEQYDLVLALYSHIIARYQTTTLDGSKAILDQLLGLLPPTNPYTYKATEMLPFSINFTTSLTGSGTTGTIPKFTGVASVGDSIIKEDNGKIGIGKSPTTTLDVDGAIKGTSIVKDGGTSSQFLKADGSVDSSTYLTTGTAASTYVPYTGATLNVDLGEKGLKSGYLAFDTTPTGTPTSPGTVSWDSFYRTLSLVDGDGDTTLQIGQEQRVLIHNNTGATLTDGQVVYITGSTGELPSVALAYNTTETTSSVTLGVVTESILNGANGFITTNGIVHGLNTNAFDEGAAIWLSSTPGVFTQTKPIAPNNSVLVGYVVKKSGGNGSIFVKIQNGYELDELHNVAISSIANNQGLFYESATSLWKNKTIETVLGYTPEPTIAAGTITQYYRGDKTFQTLNTTAVAEGTNLYYTEGRVSANTDVAANTAARHNAVTLGTANGLSLSTQVLSLGLSSASTNGALSSTDWSTFNAKQAAGNYITSLTGEATASGPGSASVTILTSAVTAKLLTGLNLTPGGSIASTDSILAAFGKLQNQISAMVGGVMYNGVWNASTNSPSLTSSIGTKGLYYIVSVAGGTDLDGITDWKVGDWAIFNGTVWNKVDNTDAVSSVNGYTGAVSLVSSDVPEGLTNLYYTDARARAALSAGTGISYDSGTGVITNAVTSGQIATALGYTPANGADYLPLAGGTMGGAIFGTTATFASSSSVTALGITLSGASGDGVKINHSAGRAFNIQSSGGGFGILINNETASTSAPFTIQKQGLAVITLTDAGAGSFASSLTANSFIKSGGTSSQFLKADGSVDSSTYAKRSGLTDGYLPAWSSSLLGGSLTDSFISYASNITYVAGMGLSTLNGLDIEGNYGAGTGGLKIRSYDETTGNAYIDFANTGGRMYLGLNRSTAGGLMTNATAYATVLTTGLGTSNLEFGTNATKRMTIDGTTGAVTLTSALSGTSASFSGLTVDNNQNGSTWVIAKNQNVGSGAAAGFLMTNNTGDLGAISLLSSGNSPANGLFIRTLSTNSLILGTNSTANLTIASGGAATFSSSVSATSVALNGSIANSADAATLTIKQTSTSYNNGIYLERGGERNGYHMYIGGALDSLTFRRNYFGTQSDVMSLTRDGNVGIGTTSPLSPLHLVGSTTGAVQLYIHNVNGATNSSAELVFGTWGGAIPTGSSNPGPSAKIVALNTLANDARTDLAFHTYASTGTSAERMRITSGGNVGIGTTSPSYPLHVVIGSTSADANNTNTGSTANLYNYFVRQKGASNGISGIQYMLQTFSDAGANGMEIYTQGASSTLVFGTAATERMRITSVGHIQTNGNPVYAYNGSISIGGTYQTIFAAVSGGVYLVSVTTDSADGTFGLLTVINDPDKSLGIIYGNNISLQFSGDNVQMKSTNGSTYNTTWTATRLK